MGSIPFHLNLSTLSPGTQALLDPKDLCVLPDVLCISVQFSLSVTSYSLLYHGCSKPGFPVHHQLSELAQTHVHGVNDAIQLSHPLSSPSPPAFNLSQHQGLFKWVGSFQMSWFFISGGRSIGASASASVLPRNIQGWFPLGWLVWSPYHPRDSQAPSPTPQFNSIISLVFSLLYGPTLTSIHNY